MKIFKMLNLLYEDKAYYKDVVNIFKDELNEQSTNNLQVILNKYTNTLKVFGVKIKKEGHKFKLENSLCSIGYTVDDLKSISILINTSKDFPDKDISKNINEFVHNLTMRMNSQDRTTLENLANNQDFSFYYSDLRNQIGKCTQICKENHMVSIKYLKNKKEIEKSRCIAKEVIYDSKTAYLQIYDTSQNEKIDIPLPNILSLEETPQKVYQTELTTTVVFKLKNRLAKTYKIKENEYAKGYDEEGNLIVVNKDEPFEKLLSRLMRYSYNCEIITPVTLRNRMKALINDILKQYE